MLVFEWDDANVQHIALHGITPAEVEFAMNNPVVDYGLQDWHEEERFLDVGSTQQGRVLEIITTMRDYRIRVVTAYDASRQATMEYYEMRGCL